MIPVEGEDRVVRAECGGQRPVPTCVAKSPMQASLAYVRHRARRQRRRRGLSGYARRAGLIGHANMTRVCLLRPRFEPTTTAPPSPRLRKAGIAARRPRGGASAVARRCGRYRACGTDTGGSGHVFPPLFAGAIAGLKQTATDDLPRAGLCRYRIRLIA